MKAFAIAIVTSRGICFRGRYYSCDRAIRECWFEKAHINGEWPMIVNFNPFDIENLVMYDYENDEWDMCNLVNFQSMTGKKLDKYFESIQKLKRLKHKRIRRQERSSQNVD
jgi:hypothetical protein